MTMMMMAFGGQQEPTRCVSCFKLREKREHNTRSLACVRTKAEKNALAPEPPIRRNKINPSQRNSQRLALWEKFIIAHARTAGDGRHSYRARRICISRGHFSLHLSLSIFNFFFCQFFFAALFSAAQCDLRNFPGRRTWDDDAMSRRLVYYLRAVRVAHVMQTQHPRV